MYKPMPSAWHMCKKGHKVNIGANDNNSQELKTTHLKWGSLTNPPTANH